MKTYFRLILFTFFLLVGLQVPAFLQQYQLVSTARYAEAQQNLSGFQQTADRYFNGQLDQLIQHYEKSSDPVIQDDSQSVLKIARRVAALEQEQEVFKQSQPLVAWHVVTNAQPDVLAQTQQEYSYLVPLNTAALAWGFSVAIALSLLFETLWGTLCFCCKAAVSTRKPA
ncbi:DUF2937 family protein [Gayadomonas joobiniege]|uniref:DUF2937 family protein n=1 Tax=Gayadomonas joobiniege TaxID=1234606 RepID=UPI0003709BDF|nr:DUF2937 family protein [Gayadomonas joobiniege]